MKTLRHDPLVHFLFIGGLIFAIHYLMNPGAGDTRDVVRISAAEVNWLKGTWTRQWLRDPSVEELRGLIAGYLREELLAREAREMGLDIDDTIVRRRLAQKLEFLVKDTTRLEAPDEALLYKLYEANTAAYQSPALISFTQRFFATEDSAQMGRAELERGGAADPGERTLLARDLKLVDKRDVAASFGADFAERIFDLEIGRWHGPVPSSYGFHLVKLHERRQPQIRSFDEIRAQLQADWYRQQEAEASRQYFAGLLEKYEVVVDPDVRQLVGSLADSLR